MSTPAFIWLASVIGASVLLHFLINRSPRFYEQRYLLETEFRFNHRNDNLYKVLLKRLREDPL